MEDDYYSIESILAENQKIQCTFKADVLDMGHLDGGKSGDVGILSFQMACMLIEWRGRSKP